MYNKLPWFCVVMQGQPLALLTGFVLGLMMLLLPKASTTEAFYDGSASTTGTGAMDASLHAQLSKLILDRVMTLRNLLTVEDARIYYKSLTPAEAADYVSFDTRSPDYKILTQATCGYQICSTLPEFSSYSTELLESLKLFMNDYLQILDISGSQSLNEVRLTDANVHTYYIALYNNKDIPHMNDDSWWKWYMADTTCIPLLGGTLSPGTGNVQTLAVFLYYLRTQYMQDASRKIPDMYIMSNTRKLLSGKTTSTSSDNNDFMSFIHSCMELDDGFAGKLKIPADTLTTSAIANGAPKIADQYQQIPAIRYFKYKAGFSISSFRQLFLDIIDVYDCKQIISAALPLMKANAAIAKLTDSFPLTLKVNDLHTILNSMTLINLYPVMYQACKDTHTLQHCLQVSGSDNGDSLRQYLRITDSQTLASFQNIMESVAVIFNNIPKTVTYVDYQALISHFQGIADDDKASWCGWMQLLNDPYISKTRTTNNDTKLVKKYLCNKTGCTDPVYQSIQNLASDDQDRKITTADILNTTMYAKYAIYATTVLLAVAAMHAFKLQPLIIQISSGMFVVTVVIIIIIYGYNFFTSFGSN